MRKSFKESERSVEYSDICHVLSNLFLKPGVHSSISLVANHLRSLKGKFCIISIGEIPCQLSIQISIMFSVIFFFEPGVHSSISVVAG